ncbi:G-protein coupled receptor 35-like [Mustelus asterias]
MEEFENKDVNLKIVGDDFEPALSVYWHVLKIQKLQQLWDDWTQGHMVSKGLSRVLGFTISPSAGSLGHPCVRLLWIFNYEVLTRFDYLVASSILWGPISGLKSVNVDTAAQGAVSILRCNEDTAETVLPQYTMPGSGHSSGHFEKRSADRSDLVVSSSSLIVWVGKISAALAASLEKETLGMVLQRAVLSRGMNCTANSSQDKSAWSHQVVMLVFSLPTICIGLVLNGVAFCIIWCKIKQRTKSTIYMSNLIISDILLLFSLPFKIYAYYVRQEWPLGKRFCQLLESFCFVNTYASILLITLICVDRYLAIKHPFLSRAISSPRKTALICAGIWVVVGPGSTHIYLSSNSPSCFYDLSPEVWSLDFIAALEVLFLTCASLMMFCSLQIIRRLKVTANQSPRDWTDKSTKIILSNLLTFLVCFTPYHTGLLLYSLATNGFLWDRYCEPLRSALHICLYLANVNCCLDAIYYFYGIKELFQSNSRPAPNSSIQMTTCELIADLTTPPLLNS